jgi:DNA-binding NarL/FixJ family response regulator
MDDSAAAAGGGALDEERPDLTGGDRETMRVLQGGHDYILTLPPEERHIAALAAQGSPVWEIAQEMRMSEGAVAHTLDNIVAVLTGREVEQVETGGLGADTDPGPSGGYDPDPFGGAGT